MVVLPRPPKPHFLQSPLPWVHPRLQAELPGNRCSLSALLVETLETARLINDIRLIQERYAWSRQAADLRDAALERYSRAKNEEDRQRIAQEVAEALNEA